jgi:hypothetical protein
MQQLLNTASVGILVDGCCWWLCRLVVVPAGGCAGWEIAIQGAARGSDVGIPLTWAIASNVCCCG